VQQDWSAVKVVRPEGRGPFVLVCEHAAREIPEEFAGLGLSADARDSHAAWDIGAMEVAVALSDQLDAPLVAGGVSRLVYDLNRPLDAASAIPERSEIHDVPGNRGLDAAARRDRFERVHEPFHNALSGVLDARTGPVSLVTVHSFTPVYNGVRRAVELGFLHHDDARLALACLAREQAAGTYRAALNEPYGKADGVTYTLARHGEARGLAPLMIEIRNDLIATTDTAQAMAAHLAGTLTAAQAALDTAEAAR
jgi:predicted N-formylglutamate amidohydrolase